MATNLLFYVNTSQTIALILSILTHPLIQTATILRIAHMKIAGVERRNKPNMLVLWPMQSYSNRGWVYREKQGWIFAELTPDEYGITIPRMRVRLPYSQPTGFVKPDQERLDNYVNWFVYCTMPQVHPLILK